MKYENLMRDLIVRELGGVEDNLYRFKMQQRAKPDWKSGNDKPIADIIADLEKRQAELKEALEEL